MHKREPEGLGNEKVRVETSRESFEKTAQILQNAAFSIIAALSNRTQRYSVDVSLQSVSVEHWLVKKTSSEWTEQCFR